MPDEDRFRGGSRQPARTGAPPAARSSEDFLELRAAEAEHLARERAGLLSMAAHDLKTPLSGIVGYVDCLIQRVAADPGASWVADELEVVSTAAHGLMDLLTDLLDRQKAEMGRVDLVPEVTEVGPFLAGLVRLYQRWAAAAGRRVELEVHGAIPAAAIDRRRLTQILNNLVHNALKHTPRGGRTVVEARLLEGGDRLEIAVADEGKGFDPSDTDRMLALFTRGTAAEPPVGEGHGLGLAIVDKLVTLHGGTLRIEARRGCGARFAVSLPLRGER